MPLQPGAYASSNFTDILRTVVEVKQTGYLKVRDGDWEGCIAVENGVILHARAGNATGLHALFQFVAWRDGKFEFHERPMPTDLVRDLAVYDPQVLLTGIVFKVEEQNLLHDAIPTVDAVVRYVGGEGLASVEISPTDRSLLALADGRRTVGDIAARLNLSPTEVAKNLGRFRMAGVLEVVLPRTPVKSGKLAAAG